MNEWERVVNAPMGHIFCDFMEGPVRCIVLRSTGSLCGYVGLPLDHPLAGFPYYDSNDSPYQMGLICHGGLTFSGTFPEHFPGWWFYGWDYNHSEDYATYYDEGHRIIRRDSVLNTFHKWTVPEVTEEVERVATQLNSYVWIADMVVDKYKISIPKPTEEDSDIIRRIDIDDD